MRLARVVSTRLVASLSILAAMTACGPAQPPRVLLFSKTAGYRHASIDVGKAALIKLGAANGFVVDTTENAARISEDSLQRYSAVVFLHTTGNVLDRNQQIDLQRFVQAGGGFVGIHAAADAGYDWKWYGRLVGGYFLSHPAIQPATLRVTDRTNASTAHLPAEWKRTDEWYNFKQRADDVHVLMSIDEQSYTGGANGATHPMSWYHDVDGGRSWYTALGHTEESYSDSLFLKHVLGGIKYAIGDARTPDFSRATAVHPPADSLFTKTVLNAGELNEPRSIIPNSRWLGGSQWHALTYLGSNWSHRDTRYSSQEWAEWVKAVVAKQGVVTLDMGPNWNPIKGPIGSLASEQLAQLKAVRATLSGTP